MACGTYGGYQQHRRNGEAACEPCREANRDYMRKWSKDNRANRQAHNRASGARFRQNLKAEVIAAYGGACSCCGETELVFLTLDHINDDGAEHRRELGNSQQVYVWLKREGFPQGNIRVLCFNCNCGRQQNGGVCPHETAVLRLVSGGN